MSTQRERREAERRHRVCGPPVARVVCVWHLQPTEMHRVSVWRVYRGRVRGTSCVWRGVCAGVCCIICLCVLVMSVCVCESRSCASRMMRRDRARGSDFDRSFILGEYCMIPRSVVTKVKYDLKP